MYAGEVGVPRLLKLFDKYGIKQTFNIPGSFIAHVPSTMLTHATQDIAWTPFQSRWQ